MVVATIQPCTGRTERSFVWGGIRAKDLESGTVFRWTSHHTEHFKKFIRDNGANSRTTADLDPLLAQLNLDGFEDVETDNGDNVESIIIKKVRDKLRRTEKAMRDGGETIGTGKVCGDSSRAIKYHAANTSVPGKESSLKKVLTHCNGTPHIIPPPYEAPQLLAVVEAHAPQDNAGCEAIARHPTIPSQPTTKAEPSANRAVDVDSWSPFLSGTLKAEENIAHQFTYQHRSANQGSAARTAPNLSERSAQPEEPVKSQQQQQPKVSRDTFPLTPSASVGAASVCASLLKIPKGHPQMEQQLGGRKVKSAMRLARKSKADRLHEAWWRFHEELLEVDQEPDDEYDDEEFFEITTYMLQVSHRLLKRNGVDRLLKLAEPVD